MFFIESEQNSFCNSFREQKTSKWKACGPWKGLRLGRPEIHFSSESTVVSTESTLYLETFPYYRIMAKENNIAILRLAIHGKNDEKINGCKKLHT